MDAGNVPQLAREVAAATPRGQEEPKADSHPVRLGSGSINGTLVNPRSRRDVGIAVLPCNWLTDPGESPGPLTTRDSSAQPFNELCP